MRAIIALLVCVVCVGQNPAPDSATWSNAPEKISEVLPILTRMYREVNSDDLPGKIVRVEKRGGVMRVTLKTESSRSYYLISGSNVIASSFDGITFSLTQYRPELDEATNKTIASAIAAWHVSKLGTPLSVKYSVIDISERFARALLPLAVETIVEVDLSATNVVRTWNSHVPLPPIK
jgi:hypothetical protein